MIPIFFALSR